MILKYFNPQQVEEENSQQCFCLQEIEYPCQDTK